MDFIKTAVGLLLFRLQIQWWTHWEYSAKDHSDSGSDLTNMRNKRYYYAGSCMPRIHSFCNCFCFDKSQTIKIHCCLMLLIDSYLAIYSRCIICSRAGNKKGRGNSALMNHHHSFLWMWIIEETRRNEGEEEKQLYYSVNIPRLVLFGFILWCFFFSVPYMNSLTLSNASIKNGKKNGNMK